MSDPSIHCHLEPRGATVGIASDDQRPKAFVAAFHAGHAKVNELVEKPRDRKIIAVLALDPNSEESKQVACFALVVGAGLIRVWSHRSSGEADAMIGCMRDFDALSAKDGPAAACLDMFRQSVDAITKALGP